MSLEIFDTSGGFELRVRCDAHTAFLASRRGGARHILTDEVM
ncbi:hypothetical protein [Nocardia aurea]|nr:hypothetical protein [Nocardia aurea]